MQQPVEYPLARSLTKSATMMVSTGNWDVGQKQQLQEQQQSLQETPQNDSPIRPQSSEQTAGLHTLLNLSVSSVDPGKLSSATSGPSSSITKDLQSQGISPIPSSDHALLTRRIASARRHKMSDAPVVFTHVASTVNLSERMFTVSRAAADGLSAFPGPYTRSEIQK